VVRFDDAFGEIELPASAGTGTAELGWGVAAGWGEEAAGRSAGRVTVPCKLKF
jgi:hypothetical protein